MAQSDTIHSGGEVQDQVILPLRVAVGICLRGIRTRLGRSVITLSGVALGIAFLMAVLSGFHIQRAMSAEAALARDVERRLAALRGEVGTLKGKAFLALAARPSDADVAFLDALASAGAVVHRGAPAEAPEGLRGALLLGDYEPLLATAAPAEPFFVFRRPTAADARLRYLGLELRPEGVALAAKRERQAAYRMAWIVAVSLLVTVGCIANAMLMSVTERFREIGTMKCLGALSSFVVKLFLIESLLMGLAGAVLGVTLGIAFPLAAYGYTFGVGRVVGAVSFGTLGLYGGLCLAAGVALAMVAAIYPARVAAKMVPAAALASHV
ncbi:MAG TPA: FtsX-like permease family protein [Planctomycetota bacterium]|nr:FtsX-like permease family protein [Planctomycetota bacterium]HRR82117.1 FtsX-like permease family protein [Planctomycetota bacterium]HRT96887.1 FtsX-like permease family protein [Planctomycetota bacterium]